MNGKEIAFTTSRTYANSFRRLISNCMIPNEYLQFGTEVTVICGNPGHPQKEIRTTVAIVSCNPTGQEAFRPIN